MRKLVAVVAAGLLGLGFLALMSSPASAELKTSISGSIRLNAHYLDRIGIVGSAEEMAPTDIPFTAGPGKSREKDNDQFQIDARRTRLQLDMTDEVSGIKLSGRLQGDFDTSDGNANTSNSRHFRIRLGWGQWQTPGGWIVRFGQVRSLTSEYGDNLFGGVADVDMVDENGEFDQLQARLPGVHIGYLTKFMGGDLIVGVGIEKSGTTLVNGGATTGALIAQGAESNQPLFGAAARLRTPLYAIFLRGAAQNQRVIFNAPVAGQKTGDTTSLAGWLAALGAEVTPGPLRVYGQYWYGNGLNRLGASYSDVSIANCPGAPGLTPNVCDGTHLRPVSTHNWHVGVAYKLTKDLKAEGSYEQQVAAGNRKIFTLSPASTDKRDFEAIHAGLIYTFWTRFDTGIEYEWARVGTFGTTRGQIEGVNARLRFYF